MGEESVSSALPWLLLGDNVCEVGMREQGMISDFRLLNKTSRAIIELVAGWRRGVGEYLERIMIFEQRAKGPLS